MSQKDTKTIGKDYTLGGLLKFALPAVLNEFMFNLLYTLDDGLFITRYVGTTAESAFSIIFPVFMVHNAIASLLSGVAVLVARKMGEKKDEEASGDFTAIVLFTLGIGLILSLLEFLFRNQIPLWLGQNFLEHQLLLCVSEPLWQCHGTFLCTGRFAEDGALLHPDECRQ